MFTFESTDGIGGVPSQDNMDTLVMAACLAVSGVCVCVCPSLCKLFFPSQHTCAWVSVLIEIQVDSCRFGGEPFVGGNRKLSKKSENPPERGN